MMHLVYCPQVTEKCIIDVNTLSLYYVRVLYSTFYRAAWNAEAV